MYIKLRPIMCCEYCQLLILSVCLTFNVQCTSVLTDPTDSMLDEIEISRHENFRRKPSG